MSRTSPIVCYAFLSFWPMMYKAFVSLPITFDFLMVNPASFSIEARSSGEKECVWEGGFPQDLTNRSPILILSQSFIPWSVKVTITKVPFFLRIL